MKSFLFGLALLLVPAAANAQSTDVASSMDKIAPRIAYLGQIYNTVQACSYADLGYMIEGEMKRELENTSLPAEQIANLASSFYSQPNGRNCPSNDSRTRLSTMQILVNRETSTIIVNHTNSIDLGQSR
jgi:hypothetical protein